MDNFITIAIDGGAASGKSTTAKQLAERLSLMHVDTGAHYRILAYMLCEKGIPHSDIGAVIKHLAGVKLKTNMDGQSAHIGIEGLTIANADLRSSEVNESVSHYAAIPEVRSFLLDYQRSQIQIAKEGGFAGLVMEGRDIGSVVLPKADYCLFLEADPETRAKRRVLEGQEDEIAKRDALDAARKTAPLTCPPHAFKIDSSELSLEEVVDLIIKHIHAI